MRNSKGVARFLEVGRGGGRVLCFGRDGKENTVWVGGGDRTWRVCMEVLHGGSA